MAMLLFFVGDNRYAIETSYILRIVPQVFLKKMPSARAYIAGLLNFGGNAIPVVDFAQLMEQRSTKPYLDSRIILIKNAKGEERTIGILGEKVSDIIPLHPQDFSQSEFTFQQQPYLDKNYSDDVGIIQHLDIEAFFHFLELERA